MAPPPNQEDPVWLTQREAADFLQVKSTETVRRLAKAKHFTRYGLPTKPGRYRKDELTEYLAINEPWKLAQ